MTSGPVVVQVLEGENACPQPRGHGRDQPGQGRRGHDPQGLRGIDRGNSVHGSDSAENAKIEIDFFFKPEEIVG